MTKHSEMICCPNCSRNYSDGFKEGYNRAFALCYKELKLASLSRPIQIIIPREDGFKLKLNTELK